MTRAEMRALFVERFEYDVNRNVALLAAPHDALSSAEPLRIVAEAGGDVRGLMNTQATAFALLDVIAVVAGIEGDPPDDWNWG